MLREFTSNIEKTPILESFLDYKFMAPGNANSSIFSGSREIYTCGYYGTYKWNGTSWDALLNSPTQLTDIFSGSDGVYVGGNFNNTSGSYVSKWNGSSWTPLGTGVPNMATSIYSGSNGVYIACGTNSVVGYVYLYNGTTSTKIGTFTDIVDCIFSGSDGVYAGGHFSSSAGIKISKWNGSSWIPLAGGLSNAIYGVFSGSDGVYVGGNFNNTSGSYVSKWNGSSWNAVGSGIGGTVYSIFSGSDGVYAGGNFNISSPVYVGTYITKWNGSNWIPLTTGSNNIVISIFSGSDGVYYADNSVCSKIFMNQKITSYYYNYNTNLINTLQSSQIYKLSNSPYRTSVG